MANLKRTRSRPRAIQVIVLAFMALVPASCNLATQPGTPSGTGDPIPEAIPADLYEAMMRNVEAGEWTLEEGLVRTLELLIEAPEERAQAELPESITGEATGLVLTARLYLESGSDERAKGDIRRLLRIIIPDINRLEKYSEPATSSWRIPGLGMALGQELDCVTLWQDGFPFTDISSLPCFLYDSWISPEGHLFRIFYPSEWSADAALVRRYGGFAMEAVTDAAPIFERLGEMTDTVLIFSPLESLAETLADTSGTTASCSIMIWPNAYRDAASADDFKFTIAHELFHCFQGANLPSPRRVEDHNDHLWWREGTAEYYANVVYPDVDLEHRDWLDEFDARSLGENLFAMSYENYLFFQYLEHPLGVEGILDLLNEMPYGGGPSAQIAALAAYPGMEVFFHQFAQDYLDNRIVDTSGRTIRVNPHPHYGEVIRFGDGDTNEVRFRVGPFILVRYQLVFDEGRSYTLTWRNSGASALTLMRPVDSPGTWGELGAKVDATCGSQTFVLMIALAQEGEYGLRLNVLPGEEEECEPEEEINGLSCANIPLTAVSGFLNNLPIGSVETEIEEDGLACKFQTVDVQGVAGDLGRSSAFARVKLWTSIAACERAAQEVAVPTTATAPWEGVWVGGDGERIYAVTAHDGVNCVTVAAPDVSSRPLTHWLKFLQDVIGILSPP